MKMTLKIQQQFFFVFLITAYERQKYLIIGTRTDQINDPICVQCNFERN